MEAFSYPRSSLQILPVQPNKTLSKDPSHWNSIIKHQAKLKKDEAILETYAHMESLNISPNADSLPLILKACSNLKSVETGKRVHFKIRNHKLIDDLRVRTGLVDFYCKCGILEDARPLFDQMLERDVILWNVMINGYVVCQCYKEALRLFQQMVIQNVNPSSRTLVALLLACGELLEFGLGQEIHGYCLRSGMFDSNYHIGSALIGFYMRFNMRISRMAFDSMATRSVVNWNTVINGYLDVGDHLEASGLFLKMLYCGIKCDNVSILLILKLCAEISSLESAMQIHQMAIKLRFLDDLHIINALLNTYSKCDGLESSRKLFDSAPTRDVAIWNSMISAYSEFRYFDKAWNILSQMQSGGVKMNGNSISILLSVCAESATELSLGKSLHANAIKSGLISNIAVANALLSMYSELNHIEKVIKVFGEMEDRDILSYNTVIMASAKNGFKSQAWNYFLEMLVSDTQPNSHTVISVLAVCEGDSDLSLGKCLHGYAIKHNTESNLELNTALTEMYMSCCDEATARLLFEIYPIRDLISWNSLIACYIRNGLVSEALSLFHQMMSEVEPNSVTLINVLLSCTHLSFLPLGKCLHGYSLRRQYLEISNFALENALLSMYARCGSIEIAERVFNSISKRGFVSWNAMIAGYGQNGQVSDALAAFSKMVEDGLRPNGTTFLSLLSACSHAGMIEQGFQLFKSMTNEFNINPTLFHYGCMVDLLGRAGYVHEAKEIVSSMSLEPDASIWRALLTSCRLNADLEFAKTIFEKLVEFEPSNAGNYVALTNVYAAAGEWSEVRNLRMELKKKGLGKDPGVSWIFVRNKVHCFTSGYHSHPISGQIYAILHTLVNDNGFETDILRFLHDGVDSLNTEDLL